MTRLLFVCTGNICRSPAAHAVLQAHAARAGLALEVDSAGLGGWHAGELPDPRARAEGARRGYRLDHPARQVTREELDRWDLVVAMDRSHERGLLRLHPGLGARLQRFRVADPDAPADPPDVLDPYYDGPEAFVAMFDVLEAAVPGWLRRLGARAGRRGPTRTPAEPW